MHIYALTALLAAVYALPLPDLNIGHVIGAASIGVLGGLLTAKYAPSFTSKVLNIGRTVQEAPLASALSSKPLSMAKVPTLLDKSVAKSFAPFVDDASAVDIALGGTGRLSQAVAGQEFKRKVVRPDVAGVV